MTEKIKRRTNQAAYPEYLSLVGQIAVECVDLDWSLGGLLGRMLFLRLKQARALYLTPMNERARLDILENAAHEALAPGRKPKKNPQYEKQKEQALKKVVAIVKRSRQAFNDRNVLVHHLWEDMEEDGDEETMIIRPMDGKVSGQPKRISVKELKAQLEKLTVLRKDVMQLRKEFKEHPPVLVSMASDQEDAAG